MAVERRRPNFWENFSENRFFPEVVGAVALLLYYFLLKDNKRYTTPSGHPFRNQQGGERGKYHSQKSLPKNLPFAAQQPATCP
jgi:hypothetical protein